MRLLYSLIAVIVLVLPGQVRAQSFERVMPLGVEDPKINVEFRHLQMRDAFAAIFEQAPGWTYSIHPQTPIPNDTWFDVHFVDLQLSWCVRGLISGYDIGYTVADTHYYIHPMGYVVPEPSSMLALLGGMSVMGGWAGKQSAKKRQGM